MRKLSHGIAALICCICLLILCPSCGEPKVINTDTLDGCDIAVSLRAPEFKVLDELDYRCKYIYYDIASITALELRAGRVDALLTTLPSANEFCRNLGTDAFKVVPLNIKFETEISYPFRSGKDDFIDEFAAFLKEFRRTPEYEDLYRRVNCTGDSVFESKPVENVVTTDRVFTAGASGLLPPFDYIDTATGESVGAAIELMTHFANSIGAKLVIYSSEPPDMMARLRSGTIDCSLLPSVTTDPVGGSIKVVSTGSWPIELCLITHIDTQIISGTEQ